MLLEAIYSDLEAIAKKRGPLNEDAVRLATTILARPRYAESPSPSALLVEDLERVIDSIPNYPAPETSPPWASQNFRDYARRYFSLDGAGQTLSHRRAFGRKDPGGSVLTWMHRGVLYRVAAGLVELWAVGDSQDSNVSERTLGYRIDFLHEIKHFNPDGSARNILKYELHVITSGPHILVLPLAAQSTTLTEFDAEHAGSDPKPQVVEVDGTAVSCAALVFSVQQPAERVRIKVQHTTRDSYPQTHEHTIDHQVKRLVLEVNLPESSRNAYKWEVRGSMPGSPDNTIDEPSEGMWACENPQVGKTYRLIGTQLTRAERRQKRLKASTRAPDIDNS